MVPEKINNDSDIIDLQRQIKDEKLYYKIKIRVAVQCYSLKAASAAFFYGFRR
ncbi:hypothetical protein [Bacillus salipaludis]|uniref:Uncharacterized protein n=1 Tax=Bacillus salipaludis TaxID=2547811 RepID=A0AA90ZAG2_9BACI|nr:hypothetical protein [Bacillus salipaludis]MDQ6601000.1 hypothetical protein [Bacillus salipaludis]